MTKNKDFIRRYTSIAATIDIIHRNKLPLLDPQMWDDRNDRYFMNLYKEAQGVGGLYGLCAATRSETYHHWRVFTASADGACIEVKRRDLENLLGEQPNVRFQFAEVDYLRLSEIEKLSPSDKQRLPFIKRFGFKPEAEYRIIAETPASQKPTFEIDFPICLINKVYLNPWLPASIAESLKTTIRCLPGCGEISISHSRLIDSSRWKKAGDRVIGKSEP